MKQLSIFLLLLLFTTPLSAQDKDIKDWYSPGSLRSELEFICDSLSAGRAFASSGIQHSTTYLIRQFRNAGLRNYVQSFREDDRIGHNVIAVTPGWFKQYIVVGAYYDGIGTIDGNIYPCADANGSGVAALLALARCFASSDNVDISNSSTGIIFVAFDGHNSGLSGSREFVARFASEYRISLMINLDILGNSLTPPSRRRDYLIALGGQQYWFSMDSANRIDRLQLSYDYYGSERFTDFFYSKISDQKWFLEAGIPAVMFTSGISKHTNKTSDTAANLDYEIFSRRVSFIHKWIKLLLRSKR